jgi:tetratricopeptide (TPR) repeat protein
MKARFAFAALLATTCFSASFTAVAAPETPAGPAPAPAPAPAADASIDEARQHFQKGVLLFKEGNLDAALAEFRRAYQLAPSYRVLYNIAQVHHDLHNYVEALKAYRQYLSEGGNDISAERRTQVDAEVRKLEGRVGYLEITSNVDGVQLSLDEVPAGILPLRTPIMVNPGVRRVSASKVGYALTARNVTIVGGDHAQVQLDMTEIQTRGRDDGKKTVTTVHERPRTAMWISLAATGALGVTSGVFAILARSAKQDFETELGKYPNTKDHIDDARSKLALNSGLADGFGAAAVVAGGFTVFFALAGRSTSTITTTASAPPPKRIAFAPTLNGVVAVGEF